MTAGELNRQQSSQGGDREWSVGLLGWESGEVGELGKRRGGRIGNRGPVSPIPCPQPRLFPMLARCPWCPISRGLSIVVKLGGALRRLGSGKRRRANGGRTSVKALGRTVDPAIPAMTRIAPWNNPRNPTSIANCHAMARLRLGWDRYPWQD